MHPILFEVAGHPVFAFGTFLAIGFFLAYLYTGWRCRQLGISDTHILNIFIILIVGGVSGSRLMAVALSPEHYPDFRSILMVTNGGMAFHGGLLVALGGGILYLIATGLPVGQVLDRFGPAVPLAHASGRIGCFLFGCCFGLPCTLPWAIRMPPADPSGQWPLRHPTQLYELVLLLILTWVLHKAIDRPHRAGLVMVFYGYGYPIVRFPLEFIRADHLGVEPHLAGLSMGQLSCLGMAAIAGIVHWWLLRHPEAPAQASGKRRRERAR
ncbi:MAG: prolipoprotein diacylglyceryl transferase [Candidatus Riflebacteria bacterium]|nr:prolipoprotein diacylglyceryl transferase [Candidatus Riflebacteria bacterium]